jgi:8-oxo-dGTP pyrophosphatase MutT (NUDIX family)
MSVLMAKAGGLEKHFTVTGYTVTVDRTRLLMVFHRKLDRWLPPGGHVETDEFPSDAVLREVAEETGIVARHRDDLGLDLRLEGLIDAQLPTPLTMSAQLIPAGKTDGEHIHMDMMYELFADLQLPSEAEDEVSSARWFTRDEVLNGLKTFDAVRTYARERMNNEN